MVPASGCCRISYPTFDGTAETAGTRWIRPFEDRRSNRWSRPGAAVRRARSVDAGRPRNCTDV